MTQMLSPPARSLVKAIFVPSGEKRGCSSHATPCVIGVAARYAIDRVDLAIVVAAAVAYPDQTIVAKRVLGRHIAHALALEKHRQTGDFMPLPGIAGDIERLDRGHFGSRGGQCQRGH